MPPTHLKRIMKLFFTFFIIYSIFVHSVGWNDQTRILSAISLVDEKRLEIDNYANLTGDRIHINNHYYSDKPLGTSSLLTPIYSVSKFLTNDKYQPTGNEKILLPQPQINTTLYIDINPGNAFKMTSIIGTIFLSSLPGALIVVLIYIILINLTKDEKTSLITSVVFGLGTIIFSYSTVLIGNILPLLFIIIVFYLSFIRQNVSKKIHIFSGILLSISVVFDFTFVFFSFLITIFMAKKIKRNIFYLIIGVLIGIAPLLIYNFLIFQNPFTFSIFYPDREIFPPFPVIYTETNLMKYPTSEFSLYKSISGLLHKMLWVLFYPYRGLFIYMPFLLFSLLGIKEFYKSNKELSILIFLLFFIYLVANGIYSYWFGGSSFGPRYLLPAIPFLSIPLVYFIKNSKRKYVKFILFTVVLVSIFHTILGTSNNWEGIVFHPLDDNYQIFVEWFTKNFSTNAIEKLNPLYEHYLPSFLNHGPRSRILEYLLVGEIPDIRDFNLIPAREIKLFTLLPIGISVFKITFLIIPISLIIVTLIWGKELSKISLFKKLTLLHISLAIILLLFASRLEFKEITYDKNWYPVSVNATHVFEEKWIKDEASVYYYSPKEETKNLLLEIGTFYKPREVEIKVNEKPFNYTIFSYKENIVIPSIKVKSGENIIRFKSLSECDKPYLLINGSEDPRCLSFILHSIKGISSLPIYQITLNENWYPKELNTTWAFKSPSLIIKSNEKASAKLNLTLVSYNKPRELGFVINDILFDNIRVETWETNVITKTFPLKAGDNILKFITEDCDIPAEVEGTDDKRCLSFGIIDIQLISPYTLDKKIVFGPNWYEQEKDGGRWMSNDGSIFLFSNVSGKAKLSFDMASYRIDRIARVYLNKELVFEKKIDPLKTKIAFDINLKDGENLLEIENDKPCQIPALIEGSKENRCLSFKLFNLKIDEI